MKSDREYRADIRAALAGLCASATSRITAPTADYIASEAIRVADAIQTKLAKRAGPAPSAVPAPPGKDGRQCQCDINHQWPLPGTANSCGNCHKPMEVCRCEETNPDRRVFGTWICNCGGIIPPETLADLTFTPEALGTEAHR